LINSKFNSINNNINLLQQQQENPSISYLDMTSNGHQQSSEHIDAKYLSEVYCSNLQMKNKFFDVQRPETVLPPLVECVQSSILQEDDTEKPSTLTNRKMV